MTGDSQPPPNPALRIGTLSADDWSLGALEVIGDAGVSGLTVESLATRLGVTKGSFYWHFRSRKALFQAALARWEADDAARLDEIAAIEDPAARIRKLAEDRSGTPNTSGTSRVGLPAHHSLDLAMSNAAHDPTVYPVLQRVAERRVDHLNDCYLALGLSAEEAAHRALLHYAVYTGSLRLTQEVPSLMLAQGPEHEAYREYALRVLMPDGSDHA